MDCVVADGATVYRVHSFHESSPSLAVGGIAEKRLLNMIAVGQLADHQAGFLIGESFSENRP